MKITEQEKNKPRAFTNKLIEGLEFGIFDAAQMAAELLEWLSEDEAKEFALYYEYIEDDDEEDDEEGGGNV